MSNRTTHQFILPPEQQSIRDKCFHPSGAFVEFSKEDVETSIPERFEKIVRLFPDRVAIKESDSVVTYSDLRRMANSVAKRLLRERGSKAEAVALLFENGAQLVASILGVLKAGKCFVLLDPSFPAARNAAVVKDSRAEVLFTDKHNADLTEEFTDVIIRLIGEFLDAESSDENVPIKLSPQSLAYVAYTSGSTGEPKGVINNHCNVLFDVMLRTNAYHISHLDRLSLIASASVHAINNIFFALLNGAMLLPFNAQKESASRLGEWLSRERISICRITIQLFRELCRTLTGAGGFDELRLSQFAGDSRFISDVELWKKYFPPSCLLANGISSSESGYLTDYLVDHATQFQDGVMPAGYAVTDKELLVLDENGKALGVNQVGELAVRSAFLSPGYWRRLDLTKEKFKDDPNGHDSRIFFTGDLGLLLSDGCVVYKGRKDFRVKIRGYNVETAEVENALCQHRNVTQSGVVAWEREGREPYLVAYVVPRRPVPSVDDLLSFLKDRLAEYMIPSSFVFMDSLPLTNGKLDRKALPEPENRRPKLTTPYVSPRNDVEERLVQLWQTVLGVDGIGIHDNFFDLGGHSLLATRVLSAVKDVFGVDMSMRDLLDTPTVAELTAQVKFQTVEGQTHTTTNRIAVTKEGDVLPLSYAEEGLWFIEQIQPGMTAWNMQARLRLRGSLDENALRQTFDALIQRHEVLRTSYHSIDGKLGRFISSAPVFAFSVSAVDPSMEASWQINRISAEDERRPFDLAKAPLFRTHLVRVSEQDHVLIVTQHHIITDAWSTNLLLRELCTLYDAYAKGRHSPLAELPIQYSDYALWARQSDREGMADQVSYWQEKLKGCVVQEIPTDRNRPLERNYRGAQVRILLSGEHSRELAAFCKVERVTLFMLLVAAFKVLLSRYTGSTDIVVGSALAGRDRPELENLIGMFINILALRTDLSGQPTFREILRRVRETCLEAYQHQDMPFEKLVEKLNPGRALSRNTFFQVLFNVVDVPAIPAVAGGLTVERMARPDDTARFDLTLYAPHTADGIEIIAAYNRSLFNADRIVEMLAQYKFLLEQIVENPDRSIELYSLVTPAAMHLLPDPTAKLDDTWHGSVQELFACYAQEHPDKVAIKDPSGNWSFRELNVRSNQLANYLIARGIEKEDVVAVRGQRNASLVCALLGILKAGAAFCVIDPNHPPRRVEEYVSATDAKALIQIGEGEKLDNEMAEMLDLFRWRVTLPFTNAADAWRWLAEYSTDNPEVYVDPNHLAYVIFTSGSTGKPKGVMGRHGPLTHFLPWLTGTFRLSENDRFSFLSTLSTNKLQREIFTALCLGGTLSIPSANDIGSFGKLDEWLRKNEISVIHLTPAMAQLLDETATDTVPSVEWVFFGGDLMAMRDLERAKRLMPRAGIVNFYNSSETQRGGGYFVFPEHRVGDEEEIPPLGKGAKDVQLLILNPTNKLAGVGERGEICVRSPHLARGYLKDEALTNERFIANPFNMIPGDRIYRTGEWGRYLPDGNVEFIARGDNQVSIRGFRVDLGEIESVLKLHPNVSNAAVSLDGSSTDRLIAHLVTKGESVLSIEEIRVFLRTRLPNYMVPAGFIICESLPMTSTGKLDRRALSHTGSEMIRSWAEPAPPRTEVERTLCEIWALVLNVERVGIHDNFFDLGGHSLLVLQVLSRLKQTFSLEIPFRALFDAPTVAELAAVVAGSQAKPESGTGLPQLLGEVEAMSEAEAERKLTTP